MDCSVEEQEMPFSEMDRQSLLQLKGVGTTVIHRLEQIGFNSLVEMRSQDAASLAKQVSEMMGSTCWHNSPQARASIQAVIDLAKRETPVQARRNYKRWSEGKTS